MELSRSATIRLLSFLLLDCGFSNKGRRLIFGLLACLCGIFTCSAQEVDRRGAAGDYLTIYQKYLSGLKNTRCSMYPSCSNYAKMAFQDHSFPIAMIITADRLTRCSHDLEMYPTTYRYGFPASVDFPPNRLIPDGTIVDYTKPPVFANNCLKRDSTAHSIDFIAFLINQKNYQGALYEIDKQLFEGNANVNLYAYKLKCFEGLNRYKDGILAFEQSFPVSATSDYYTLFCVAHLYDLIGDNGSSVHYFEKAAGLFAPNNSSAHPFSELGKAYFKKELYENAKSAFRNKLFVDNNLDAFNSSIGIIQEVESFPRKKKNIAMALSIIPGAGYLYTHQPKNALTALIINGVLGYASYTSFKSKNDGVGAILSVLGLSFYLGNIVGSGNSATQYNESIKRKAFERLQTINPFIN